MDNAKAMRRVIPELAPPERQRLEPASVRRSLFSWLPSWLNGPKLVPGVAFAMAMLLIVVGWISVFEVRRSNSALDQSRKEQAALERQIADARKEGDLLADRLQRANDQIASLTRERTESPASSTPIPRFLLNPDLGNRSGGETMKLTIPSKADVAQLQLMLPKSEYRNFQAVLKPVGGDLALWSQRRLSISRTKTGEAMVELWLPASLLTKGEYHLELSGITARGQSEHLLPYDFIVERK